MTFLYYELASRDIRGVKTNSPSYLEMWQYGRVFRCYEADAIPEDSWKAHSKKTKPYKTIREATQEEVEFFKIQTVLNKIESI